MQVGHRSTSRSSSREVRIGVPFFLQSILVGEPNLPTKKKVTKNGHDSLGDLDMKAEQCRSEAPPSRRDRSSILRAKLPCTAGGAPLFACLHGAQRNKPQCPAAFRWPPTHYPNMTVSSWCAGPGILSLLFLGKASIFQEPLCSPRKGHLDPQNSPRMGYCPTNIG